MATKNKPTSKPAKPRNLLHDHPLLKKGGKHEKPHKAMRRSEHMKTAKLDDE